MTTTEACEEIRNKLQDTLLKGLGKAEDYGLFCADKEDSKKGFWSIEEHKYMTIDITKVFV